MQKQRLKKIVVAGQTPPPVGGQAVMIARLIRDLAGMDGVEHEHLAFRFTKDWKHARQAQLGKVAELFAVLLRLARLRFKGPIDLLIYPIGGPQLVPIIRDLFLLPLILLASCRVVIHFHAGGLAERLPHLPFLVRAAIRALYSRATAGVVMTEYGRRDPESLGMQQIVVVPHTVEDNFDPKRLQRNSVRPAKLLYVGHLCTQKGTPALLEAVAALRSNGTECELMLVGECLAPFTDQELQTQIHALGLQKVVECTGVLRGREKWDRFANADLFVFPSVAPYESFGLVLVEAMMWQLPIVAVDWRGNAEVLGPNPGGICFHLASPLAQSLTTALAQAFARRSQWNGWGRDNRSAYEQRFRAESFTDRLPATLKGLLESN